MADVGYLELIHAEIDGVLDERQRAELARRLLADPEARAVREELRELCRTLDAIPSVEPPAGLAASILAALPQPPAVRPWWAAPRWRYAAVIAAAIVAGAILHEVIDGARPAASDVAGTMVAARTPVTLDTVKLDEEPVSGRVSLFRDDSGFGLSFELAARVPVDVEVANGGRTVRLEGVGRPNGAGALRTAIALPGFSPDADAFELTFLAAGRKVASATLRVPKGY